jgi:hypothetical protein
MNQITLFADIAGRPTHSLAGCTRVTAAAVALPTADLAAIRELLPPHVKWKHLTEHAAKAFVELLVNRSVAIGVATVEFLDTPAWRKALLDEQVLHSEIASESKAKAGWAKPPLLVKYDLLMRANLRSLTQFLATRSLFARNVLGLAPIECQIVTDEEFSGEENIDVFKSFWNDENIPAEALATMGFLVSHPNVTLTTEQAEPLLMLADIVAGLAHSAHMSNPGRVPIPLPHAVAKNLLKPLEEKRLLAVDSYEFETDYDRVFGEVMTEARARKTR